MNKIFDFLSDLFYKHGFELYMIGSTSRDFILGNEIKDYDFATDATPDDIVKFLDVKTTFKKFGVVNYKIDGKNIDIATLRKEESYLDHRHPTKITFIKDVNVDYKRRDLTINAIYIDRNYEILDISKVGEDDLINHKLRFIGDPLTRIKEDPLRILRAFRFMKEYELSIDDKTLLILKNNLYLLNDLNPNKVLEEKKKYLKITGGKDYEF